MQGSRIAMLAINDETRFVPGNTPDSAGNNIIPEKFFDLTEGFQLVVMPLFFQQDQIGLFIFGDGPDDGGIYERLRGQLSSAIKGALLVGQLKERADILTKGIEELTQNLQEMVKSSEIIGDNMTLQSSKVQEQAGAIEEMVQNIKQIADMTSRSYRQSA